MRLFPIEPMDRASMTKAEMLESLRQILRPRTNGPTGSVPAGERYYVIGDIHGRLDLFEELVLAIEQDDRNSSPAKSTVILLGDLIDRGPDSRGVLATAREWQQRRKVRVLVGNHEQMFLDSLEDTDVLRHFLKHGGRETVLSYGLDKKAYNRATLDEVQAMMRAAIPQEDLDFISGFAEYVVAGDYLFVHAGILPGVSLEHQRRHDMIWIRDGFTKHQGDLGYIVVHGHTIFEDIDERTNRIGIDTGAYRSGRLTCMVLEGSARRYIQTVCDNGTIGIEMRENPL